MPIRELQDRRTREEWKLHRIIHEERVPRGGKTSRRVRPRLRRLAERNPRAESASPDASPDRNGSSRNRPEVIQRTAGVGQPSQP